MYIDRNEIEQYPFHGTFYTMDVNEDVPLEEQGECKRIILSTCCDITEASHTRYADFITASYVVYIPIDKNEKIQIKNGMLFSGNQYGLDINGKVVGIFPSQVGGCSIYIQDTDI